MTDALKVKKFADEYIGQYNWTGIPISPNLTVFVSLYGIGALCDFIGDDMLMETTVDCILKNGYLVVPHFEEILADYDLDEDEIDEIFPKEDECDQIH